MGNQVVNEWGFCINRSLRDMGARIDTNRAFELRNILLKFYNQAHEQHG